MSLAVFRDHWNFEIQGEILNFKVVPDLAPMLWHSFGTMAALLQEIINIYPAINPPVQYSHHQWYEKHIYIM